MDLLSNLKKELVKNDVTLKEKIKVDEETYDALVFLQTNGIEINEVIKDALKTWKKKGVIKVANEVKKQLQNESKDSEKENNSSNGEEG